MTATGTLYVVATPIGNLEDITYRAVRVLSEADIIAAEDTRVSRTLLTRYGIKTLPVSCHKFNESKRMDFFIDSLYAGKNVALVSDAGTPCICDPGNRLVAQAALEGIQIVSVCGPFAAAAAISISGFDGSRFSFIGFLPKTEKKLLGALQRAYDEIIYPETNKKSGVFAPQPVVFYESPKRIVKTMSLLATHYSNSHICLCNDLTKKFEHIYRGAPSEVLAALTENTNAEKGEYTCVLLHQIKNIDKMLPGDKNENTALSLEAQIIDVMAKKNVLLKEAMEAVYEANKKMITKKEIYSASLRLKKLYA